VRPDAAGDATRPGCAARLEHNTPRDRPQDNSKSRSTCQILLLLVAGANVEGQGLANTGGDTIHAIKQAAEVGIVRGAEKRVGPLVFTNDVNSPEARGRAGHVFSNVFDWDEETRVLFTADQQDAKI